MTFEKSETDAAFRAGYAAGEAAMKAKVRELVAREAYRDNGVDCNGDDYSAFVVDIDDLHEGLNL